MSLIMVLLEVAIRGTAGSSAVLFVLFRLSTKNKMIAAIMSASPPPTEPPIVAPKFDPEVLFDGLFIFCGFESVLELILDIVVTLTVPLVAVVLVSPVVTVPVVLPDVDDVVVVELVDDVLDEVEVLVEEVLVVVVEAVEVVV